MGERVPILDHGVVQGQVIRTGCEAGLICHEVVYAPGIRLARHAHERAFVAFSLDGIYRETACGGEFDCGARSVVFHPPCAEHAIVVGPAMVRCFVVELDMEDVRGRYETCPRLDFHHADSGPLSTLMTDLYAEFRRPDSTSSLAMQGAVLQMMAVLARRDGEMGRPRWLGQIDEIVRERFRSRLTLDAIAAEVGVSAARVSAAFRWVHRRTIAEEQRRLRIEFACGRLHEAEVPLAELAAECGFADQAHFSRAFKQLTGMTPSRYRDLVAWRPRASPPTSAAGL